MKTTEKDRLLKDVLNDESYAAFRAGLFDRLQVELRRQRMARKRRLGLALAACVPIAFALYLVLSPRTPSSAHPPGVTVVHTLPMAADQLVRTAAMNAAATLAQPHALVVATTSANVELLHSSGQWSELVSDQQLLDLFKGQPVALVTVGPGERRLVLLNADTQTE
jgi:hypothetical protein